MPWTTGQKVAAVGGVAGLGLLAWWLWPRPKECPPYDVAAPCPAGYLPDPDHANCCWPTAGLGGYDHTVSLCVFNGPPSNPSNETCSGSGVIGLFNNPTFYATVIAPVLANGAYPVLARFTLPGPPLGGGPNSQYEAGYFAAGATEVTFELSYLVAAPGDGAPFYAEVFHSDGSSKASNTLTITGG